MRGETGLSWVMGMGGDWNMIRWWPVVLLGVILGWPVGAPAVEGGEAKGPVAVEIVVNGQVAKTWSEKALKALPPAEFKNRAGRSRKAVLLSTVLKKSAVALDKVTAVKVIGEGKEDGPKGLTEREFTGDDLAGQLGAVVLFFNPDRFWTLAALKAPRGQRAVEHEARVRRVRRIEVSLRGS